MFSPKLPPVRGMSAQRTSLPYGGVYAEEWGMTVWLISERTICGSWVSRSCGDGGYKACEGAAVT